MPLIANCAVQDKDSKQRLKAMARCSQPLTAGSFSPDGVIYAYASCYDWGKGHAEHNVAQAKTLIYLHACQDSEVKGKSRVTSTTRR